MPTLQIRISADAWPGVLAALAAGFEVPAEGVSRDWAEQCAAAVFADEVRRLMEPPPARPQPGRRIRPSQVRGF